MAQILVIEPDRQLGEIYAESLRGYGHSVCACQSGQRAVQEADSQTPDIVFLEIELPRHSGIEFLYEFRSYADWLEIPAVILSNVPAGEFVASQKILSDYLGVRTCLYKPHTSLRQLVACAENLIAKAA
jgi:DNA-binding response OmpR family regulator